MIVRRKLTLCAGAYAAAIIIWEYFGAGPALVFAAAGVVFCAKATARSRYSACADPRSRTNRTGKTAWILLAVYLCSFTHLQLLTVQSDPFPDPEESAILEGMVTQKEARRGGGCRLVLRVGSINGDAVSGKKVLITVLEGDPILPGQRIRSEGKLRLPQPRRNPGCFDQAMYLRSKGISRMMTAECIRVIDGAASPIRVRLFQGKERFLQALEEHTDASTADMMQAVLFGEKACLDEETMEVFQRNGTAHILAVSGLHIGILYAAMVRFHLLLISMLSLKSGPLRNAFFYGLVGLFFAGYTMLAGFSPSVVRAVLMILLHMFAQMTGRRYDLCCAALAVGLAAIAANPYTLFQTGFQMSFLAVFSLSLFLPLISRWYTGALIAGLAIQLGLGPYILWQFGWISWIAVFVSVPVVLLAVLLVPAGMGSLCLTMLSEIMAGTLGASSLTGILDRFTGLLCDLLVRLNMACCIDQVTSLTAAAPPLVLILLYYLGLFVFASESGRLLFIRKQQGRIAVLFIIILTISAVTAAAMDDSYRKLDLVFVDVGQGDCMHIRTEGKNYLIDGGGSEDYNLGKKTLRPYLLKNGVSHVDVAFVTHLHTDHYKGICELAREGMVRRIIVSESNRPRQAEICRETGLPPDRITYLRAGHRIRLSRDAVLDVLWPLADTRDNGVAADEDENATSLIMKVTVNGVSLLATGDLGEEGEQELLRLYGSGPALQADILKVGHHGSRYSTSVAFAKATAPDAAVIQVGERNVYGHPTPEVLSRLDFLGIPVFRTDRQGAVGMKLQSGKVREVRTMIDDKASD